MNYHNLNILLFDKRFKLEYIMFFQREISPLVAPNTLSQSQTVLYLIEKTKAVNYY